MTTFRPCQIMRQCRHFSTTLQRHSKPNIQKPRVPGTERRILDAITVPIFPPDVRPLPQKCFEDEIARKEMQRSEINEAFNAFRVREAVRMFENHKMIAICHALPVNNRDYLTIRAQVMKSGFQLVFVRNDLALQAIANTRFANLAPYMTSKNAYLISEEVKVVELMKMLKKVPALALLGGVVEDRILSRDQFMHTARLPPLDTLRGELLTILSASAAKTTRLLGRHSQDLSTNLTQLVKQGSEGGEVTGHQGSDGNQVTEGHGSGTQSSEGGGSGGDGEER